MDPNDKNDWLSSIVQILLAMAFGAWAWVVKVAADKHLRGVDKIEAEVVSLKERVHDLETRMKLYHKEQP